MTVSENVISATSRTAIGSAASRRLRKQDGRIPAIINSIGKENLKIAINEKEWLVFSKKDIQIIKLKVDDNETLNVQLKDVQFDVLSNKTLHIDLLEIDMKEEISAEIPIYVHGTAKGISQGGILSQLEHEVEVICLPDNLPEFVEVDVTALEMDDAIYVKDLVLPENVKVTSDPEMLILHVAQPRVQEAEEAVEESEEGSVVEESKE